MAATAGAYGSAPQEVAAAPSEAIVGSRAGTLGLVGVLTILVAAWGGIVPFVGQYFGYRLDGTAAFTWNLAHFLLAFLPGLVGVLAGLSMLGGSVMAARLGVGGAGLLAAASGGWMAIGPWAYPALYHHAYLVHGTAFRTLAYAGGAILGPGLLLAALGGIAIGWSIASYRTRRALGNVPRRAHATVSPFPTAGSAS